MKTLARRPDTDQAPAHRAAVYIRMFKEDQPDSTDAQVNAIREWAVRSGMEIVMTDSDEGKRELFQ